MKTVVFFRAILFITLLFTHLVGQAAPTVSVDGQPRWTTTRPLNHKAISAQEGSVRFLLVDDQINLAGDNKQHFRRVAYQIMDEAGLSDASQVEAPFSASYENVTFHSIRILRDEHTIAKLEEKDIKVFQNEQELADNIYSEQWTALVILDDVRVGDIIDYSYTISGSNPVFGDKHFGTHYLGWSVAVERANISILAKPDTPLYFKFYDSDLTMKETRYDDYIEYAVDQNSLPAYKQEDYTPSWFSQLPFVSYSQYAHWGEVNDWALPLYQFHRPLPVALVDTLNELTTDEATASAANIVQWVQNSIRYFGIELGVNSHLPSSPQDTFQRRYGDCKDKAMLLIAALKHIGVEAHPVLVSSETTRSLSRALPSPGSFNHVIVTFAIDDVTYWVDATRANQQGALDQMSFPDFAWGLVIDTDTDALTPISPANAAQLRGSVQVEQHFTLFQEGLDDSVSIKTHYQGWQAERVRSYLQDIGLKKLSENYHDYLTKYFPGVTVGRPMEVNDAKEGNALTVVEHYTAKHLAETTDNKLLLTTYASDILDNVWLPTVRQRKTPFTLPYNLDITVKVSVTHDEKTKMLWVDETRTSAESNQWFSYDRQIDAQQGRISITHTYQSLKEHVSASDFGQYTQHLEGIEEALSHNIVFEKPSPFRNNKSRTRNLIKSLMNKSK